MATVHYFDNFLPQADFASLSSYVRDMGKTRYSAERQKQLYGDTVWKIDDENPSISDLSLVCTKSTPEELRTILPPGLTLEAFQSASNFRMFPTRTPVDALFVAVLSRSEDLNALVGRYGQQWVGMIANGYAYGRGAKGSWHVDSSGISGAFVYYAHERWDKDWGGQLLYRDSDSKQQDAEGAGLFLTPKPNRLIVIPHGVEHSVANVSQAAPDAGRLSIAGFFVKPEGISRIVERGLKAQGFDRAAAGAR